MQPEDPQVALRQSILQTPLRHKRTLVALAGPPACGKSTLVTALARDLPNACVVPMDGFHLDNRILIERGLLPRKGSPDTFDVNGFRHPVLRLQSEDEVCHQLFDHNL